MANLTKLLIALPEAMNPAKQHDEQAQLAAK